MKRLLLMRHGEAQESLSGMNDFARPLIAKGQQQVQDMAYQLRDILSEVDAVFCSPAVRTRETLANFYSYTVSPQYIDALYYASMQLLLEKMADLEETISFPLFISHNPGLAQFVMTLEPQCREFPPATVTLLGVKITTWREIRLQNLVVEKVFYPHRN